MSALTRADWIISAAAWDAEDLQVMLRDRTVESTVFAAGDPWRLRGGDSRRVIVMFVDSTGTVMSVDGLAVVRLAVRDSRNNELIYATQSAQVSTEFAGETVPPHVLLAIDMNMLGNTALELLESGKTLVNAVADIEWVANGKTESSKTFAVVIEFGLTPQGTKGVSGQGGGTTGGGGTGVGSGTGGGGGGGGGGSSGGGGGGSGGGGGGGGGTALTRDEVILIFQQLWAEKEKEIEEKFGELWDDKMPLGEGFAYVKNGDIESLVPGGDCGTGQVWTP